MNKHHPWCNFFTGPRKDCKQCKQLYKKYPVKELMMHEYFKNASVIKK